MHTSILLLSQYMLWFGLKFVHYTGNARDFNYATFKLVCSIGALTVQAWILNELFNEQKFTGITIRIPHKFLIFRSKPQVLRSDNATKKRKTTSALQQNRFGSLLIIEFFFFFFQDNRKFNELTEADQNTKKTMKTKAKKTAKSTKATK